MPAWCRWPRAASTSTITSTTSRPCSGSLGPDLHVMAVCQPAVPVIAGDRPPGGRERPLHPALHDPHGRPHRHPPLAHRRQPAGRGARHRVVPAALHRQGAPVPSGLLARRLSGLPAALRLHGHEHRPAPHRPLGDVQPPRGGRRRFGREAPGFLRRISRRHGPDRRVLPPDGRDGVRRTTPCPRAR